MRSLKKLFKDLNSLNIRRGNVKRSATTKSQTISIRSKSMNTKNNVKDKRVVQESNTNYTTLINFKSANSSVWNSRKNNRSGTSLKQKHGVFINNNYDDQPNVANNDY